jgi:hypothetical protein
LGTIIAAHFIGNAEAVEADHVLWGWLFYVIIGAVLILIGLVFRQHQAQSRGDVEFLPLHQSVGIWRVALTAVMLVAFAMVPRAGAAYLDAVAKDSGTTALTDLPEISGCTKLMVAAEAAPLGTGSEPGSAASSVYNCDGEQVIVTLRRYPPRIGVRPLFSSLRSATTPAGWDIIFQTGDFEVASGASTSIWRLTEGSTIGGYSAVATALWLDARPSGAGLRARVTQAMNSVRGASLSPVLIVVSNSAASTTSGAARAINSFLSRTEPLTKLVSNPLSGRAPVRSQP